MMTRLWFIKKTRLVPLLVLLLITATPVYAATATTIPSKSWTTYTFTNESDLVKIATICQKEQDSVAGSAAEASQIANRYELFTGRPAGNGAELCRWLLNSGWYAGDKNSYVAQHRARDEIIAAVRAVLVDGQRTLPLYCDEHDYLPDIRSVTNDGVTINKSDRSAYVQDKSIIRNTYGSTYTFWCFPDDISDPFGYTQDAIDACGGESPVPYGSVGFSAVRSKSKSRLTESMINTVTRMGNIDEELTEVTAQQEEGGSFTAAFNSFLEELRAMVEKVWSWVVEEMTPTGKYLNPSWTPPSGHWYDRLYNGQFVADLRGGKRFSGGTTQASSLFTLGSRAYEGDSAAQQEMIEIIAQMVQAANQKHRVKASLVIAQVIQESGWIHTPRGYTGDGSTLSENNNILGINNYSVLTSEESNWYTYRTHKEFRVGQWNSDGSTYYQMEDMKTYQSVEDCIEDYIAFMVKRHPEFSGNNNLDAYAGFLQGYTPNPTERTVDVYRRIIAKYDLEKYDEAAAARS